MRKDQGIIYVKDNFTQENRMIKKSAMFSVVIVLFIVGLVFVGGCNEKATAASEESKSICQKDTQTSCSKTLDSAKKETCGLKVDNACPADCKMACCAAKQKAGTCPSQSSKTSCPKTCPKKPDTTI